MGGGFPLGRDVATGSTVSLPFSARFNGLYLVGKNGTGKSTVLARMVLDDIAAGHGVCLLDPHGDLTTSILARYPADRQDDLILLDLKDHQHPFGINIFWCPDPDDPYAVGQTVSRVMDVLGRIWNVSDETPRVAMVLRAVAATLAECRLTMAEIRPLLSDPIFRRNTVDQVRDEEARAFSAGLREDPRRQPPNVDRLHHAAPLPVHGPPGGPRDLSGRWRTPSTGAGPWTSRRSSWFASTPTRGSRPP